MSLQQGKQMFEESAYLTQTEMEKYLSGGLTRDEQYIIEQKIQANQFNAEAMEGFEEMPQAFASMEKYKQQFTNDISGTPTWLRAPVVIPALAILVVFLISTLLIINHLQNRPDFVGENKSPIETVAVAEKMEQPYLSNFEEDQKEIVGATEIEAVKQISYSVALENQKEQKQAAKVDAPAIEPKPIGSEKKESFKGEVEPREVAPIENKFPVQKLRKSSARSNVLLRYYNSLKTVDYTKFYNQELIVPGFNIGGIDAKYEYNVDNETGEKFGVNTTTVTYASYLEKAMYKFSKDEFKEALQDYRVILEQFPEDQNALFYGGLCYYNLDKPDKAIQFFTQIEKGYINTFYEEAKWYKALSQLRAGLMDEYETTLLEIIEEDGFYAEKASERMKTLE